MITKRLLRKQVIVLMNVKNKSSFIKESSAHVANINRALKNVKLEIIANFICSNNRSIIITTNKIVSTLDLQTIEKYIKNVNNIKSNYIKALRLLQSKSYLKIIGIFYLLEDSNTFISSDVVKKSYQGELYF